MKKILLLILLVLAGCGHPIQEPTDRTMCAYYHNIADKDNENLIRCHKGKNWDCEWWDGKKWKECEK